MKSLVGLFLFACASIASASTITFDSQSEVYFVPSVTDGGYVFTASDSLGTNNHSLWPSNGTTHLMSWTNTGSVSGFDVTSTTSGSKFNASSFDFAGGYLNEYDFVTSVIVNGWANGVLVGTKTFTSGVDFVNRVYSTFNLSFAGIDTLEVRASGAHNRASFDNFVFTTGNVSSVSESSSLAMFGLGLVLLGLSRKRKAA